MPTQLNIARMHRVLIVEDNPADAELIRLAWAECKLVSTETSVLTDSRNAIALLHGLEPYDDPVLPDLVMLDYKMPTDGGVALVEIKGDPDFKHLPVIVLSGSRNPRDYLDAYQRGANCCFQKPRELADHIKLVCEIAEHWLVRAVLPRVEPSDS